MGHKAEHSVDMVTGAVLVVTVQDATLGDSTSMLTTMEATIENVRAIQQDPECDGTLSDRVLTEWVADKGYHSNATMDLMETCGLSGYISEPDRGRRRWRNKHAARDGTYANRRRIATQRGKRLMRWRGELLEQTFAHGLMVGAMRRTHLRGHENILERYLAHIAGLNLSLVMRQILGVGTPRGLAVVVSACRELLNHVMRALLEIAPLHNLFHPISVLRSAA